jgi:paraquat-inducible protein A
MTPTDAHPGHPLACHCCGLVQRLPPKTAGLRPVCARCATPLRHPGTGRNRWAAALAVAALAFYPPAMLLPLLRIERLGHLQEDSLLSGLLTLFAQGHLLVGTVVLLFSVLLPPLKLAALLALTRPALLRTPARRALIYRGVESFGRWGMLDVMLVAILVAFVKLGGLVQIGAGPGLTAFTLLVLLSLLAGLLFDPHALWDEPPT